MRRIDDIARPMVERAAKKPADPWITIIELMLRHDRVREMVKIEATGATVLRITGSTITCEPQRYVRQHFAAVIWSMER